MQWTTHPSQGNRRVVFGCLASAESWDVSFGMGALTGMYFITCSSSGFLVELGAHQSSGELPCAQGFFICGVDALSDVKYLKTLGPQLRAAPSCMSERFWAKPLVHRLCTVHVLVWMFRYQPRDRHVACIMWLEMGHGWPGLTK